MCIPLIGDTLDVDMLQHMFLSPLDDILHRVSDRSPKETALNESENDPHMFDIRANYDYSSAHVQFEVLVSGSLRVFQKSPSIFNVVLEEGM